MARHRLGIIGGDAGGLSAAAQARRLRSAEELDIVVLEQGPEASYSACGIPYWVGDLVPDRDRLIARSPAAFAAQDIDLRTDTRAEEIDLAAGAVGTSDGNRLGYDSLVVATGGKPFRPPIQGLDAAGVYGVHRLADGADIRAAIAAGAERAVVLGGGYIGLEMGEGGPSSSAAPTSAWRGPRCSRPAACRSPSSWPTRCPWHSWTPTWPNGSARRCGTWASRCRPISRCGRSRSTPTGRRGRSAPTPARTSATWSSSGWGWARRSRWPARQASRSA